MLPVVLTEQAEMDLAEILDRLDRHSPQAAGRLASAIDARCELLGQFPGTGRTREELVPGLRSIVVEQYVPF